ncbi:MAG: glucosaminidase [Pseudohongiella sp.]|nr:MAG: glucosaminidase [Pseudohongiella sp.]
MLDIPEQRRRYHLVAALLLSTAMVLLVYIVDTSAQRYRATNQTLLSLSNIDPISIFPDFSIIEDVDVKKQLFFDFLQDYVDAENRRMLVWRELLENSGSPALEGLTLSAPERKTVDEIAAYFRLETEGLSEREIVAELTLRVDTIPPSLVLSQAANESAWGTSRFTLQGNNIFGQWCYVEGCGIVPARRVAGATHEVQSFDSVAESVESYFLNINTNDVYSYLRELRKQMRDLGLSFDSMALALGLGRYSERGDNYVDEIQNIIIQNNLKDRDGL